MSKKKSQEGLSYYGMIISQIWSLIIVFWVGKLAGFMEEPKLNIVLLLLVVSVVLAFIFASLMMFFADSSLSGNPVSGYYDMDEHIKSYFHRQHLTIGMFLTYFLMECAPFVFLTFIMIAVQGS